MPTPQDWLNTYYPHRANETEPHEAIEHSLQKWKGLRQHVLDEHGLKVQYRSLLDAATGKSVLEISGSSCSLCVHFYKGPSRYDEVNQMKHRCHSCPLYQASGKPCDADGSAWDIWHEKGDTEPMVKALEDALVTQMAHEALATG